MTTLPDYIKTPADESEFRIKEKGSVFISISKPVESEDGAVSFLNSVKKKYYDATHHCFSYKLIDGTFKYSDDGEPNGTAGIRIFNAQNHFNLTNIITIVVRYFGGTKLGVGPLGKAYYESAFGGMNNCKIAEKVLHLEIIINYDYDQSKTVHHFITKHALIITDNSFVERPSMICFLPSYNASNFFSDISIFITKFEVIQTDKSIYIIKSN